MIGVDDFDVDVDVDVGTDAGVEAEADGAICCNSDIPIRAAQRARRSRNRERGCPRTPSLQRTSVRVNPVWPVI